jgi:hypothetical protein
MKAMLVPLFSFGACFFWRLYGTAIGAPAMARESDLY